MPSKRVENHSGGKHGPTFSTSQASASHAGGTNLAGAVVGPIYLLRKNALPSVISNLAWAVITVGGLVIN